VNGDTGIGIRTQAPGPVVLAGPSSDHVRVGVGDAQLVATGSERNAVHFAPSPDDTVAGAELTFKSTHTPTLFPVLDTNKSVEHTAVREIDWHEETIVSIVEERYAGELVDLTVEDDESYVASGIIVHNCRSTVRALSERMAQRAGGVTAAPKPKMDGDWGLAPSVKAPPLEPDLKKYESHAAREYEKKQRSMRAREAKARKRRAG